MPRSARKNARSIFYHVMVQGINREFIFSDDMHINHYKNIIMDRLQTSNVTILAYCIMNNHSHFLIHSEETEYLSKFMQKINTSYSRFYNTTHKRIGYVFRDRYLSQDILNQKQLYSCLKYIHNNPVKANMVHNIADYKYSSYIEFIGKKQIITEKSIELLFGDYNNFEKNFILIHNYTDYNEKIIDIKDVSTSEFINTFKNKLNVTLSDINNDPLLLKKFINEAREQTNVTIIELAKILNISKSKVGYYISKENNNS